MELRKYTYLYKTKAASVSPIIITATIANTIVFILAEKRIIEKILSKAIR